MRPPTLIVSEILPFLFSIASIEKRLQLDFHLGNLPPPKINIHPPIRITNVERNRDFFLFLLLFLFLYFTTIEEEEERRARARGGGG